MNYRSLSFHESCPDEDLVRLGGRLGYNDLTFQTEHGTLPRLADLRRRADRQGYFELARELGMTISVWTHEFGEYDDAWGPPEASNDRLWDAIARRYDHVLGELLPELDHLVLTIVESGRKVAGQAVLARLVETVYDRCRDHGKTLIFRTFVHHPEEHAEVQRSLADLPPDVVIMTKAVPQDWHLRHIDHPLLGDVGGRRQFVEVDICGEYWKLDRLPHAIGHVLARQFAHWVERGIDGISVRPDRGWKPWDTPHATVMGMPQEADLWLLGMLASGQADSAAECWRAWAQEYFPHAVDEMIEALMPTGRVVEEALCVGRETFGCPKRTIPGLQTMHQKRGWIGQPGDPEALAFAEAYPDEADCRKRNPFFRHWSVHRWDPAYREDYLRMRRGDPAVVAHKQERLAEARKLAERSLKVFRQACDRIDPQAARWLEFLLEDSRLFLECMGEITLAWLKAERRLYTEDQDERRGLLEEIAAHLDRLASIHRPHAGATVEVRWRGRTHRLERLECLDPPGFRREFTRFFGLDSLAENSD